MYLNNFSLFRKLFTGLCVLGMLLITGAAIHHGWAHYDQDTTLEYTGTIQESGMENPHSYIKLEVEEKDEVWLVILAPPSRMLNRGVTEEMLETGNTVSVVGYPHRETKGEMRAERIIIGDQTVELR